ncbi:hypothetical protein BDF22DRAFT_315221 [Syncephalis plumigaleata]|nr:hypothetical protein BDF22DRAFT_315221 [Syncephalis plumigaleata]
MESSLSPSALSAKRGTSKYDFVKLRVHLSSQHYYVLSRFLVSRMLMATKVSVLHATRIALDLKKRLVDRGALDVSQLELEQALFQLMAEKGYGRHSIRLFWTLNRLHHQRIPLVILIGGAGSVGKSTLATQLAERLNLTNTLKTDLICEMTRSLLGLSEACTINTTARSSSSSSSSLVTNEPDACALVRRGLEIELRKCLSSGKSVIVEGEHVDVALLNFVLRCLDDEYTSRKKSRNTAKSTFVTSSMRRQQQQQQQMNNTESLCKYRSSQTSSTTTICIATTAIDENSNNMDVNRTYINSYPTIPIDDTALLLDNESKLSQAALSTIHRQTRLFENDIHTSLNTDSDDGEKWSCSPETLPANHSYPLDTPPLSYSETDSFDSYSSSSASSNWGDEDAPLGIVVPLLLTVNDVTFHQELIEETSRSFGWTSADPPTDANTSCELQHKLKRERTRQDMLICDNARQPAPLRQFITIVRDRDTAHTTLDRMHDTVLAEIAATL